jgi:CAAX prenyl protease-like protein
MNSMACATVQTDRRALLNHILPFAAWLVVMEILPPQAWSYAIRSLVGLALLLWCRPWRYYSRIEPRHLPLALIAGMAVFIIWILPELPFIQRWPYLVDLYGRWGILPPWSSPTPVTVSPYTPNEAGWPLAVVKLLGSAFIIAPIEEVFWRGFLYRWLVERDFRRVALSQWQTGPFWVTAVLFGIEHDRWLVGILAGVVYGLLVLRSRNLGTAIWAHIVTNLALGLYVLAAGDYRFW